MDLSRPHLDLGTGATGDVLMALAGLEAGASGRQIATRAQRSTAQVAVVLRSLVDAGLVTEHPVPPAVLYELNRDHVLHPVVDALVAARSLWLDRLGVLIESWPLPPDAVVVFGSAATGAGTAGSDIDVLVVRDEGLADDERWQLQLLDLTVALSRWTGNDIDLLELSPAELHRNRPLHHAITRDGVTVFGAVGSGART